MPCVLRRAGLPVDRMLGLVPARPDVGRGAAGLAGGLVDALPSRRSGRCRRGARGALAGSSAPARAAPARRRSPCPGADARPVPLPPLREGVGERRVGDGHLQRRGQQIALADRQVHVVADAPRPHFGDDAAASRGACAARTRARPRSAFARQARSGTTPVISLGRSMPVCWPTPSLCASFWITLPWLLAQLADFEEVRVGGDLQRFDEPDRRRSRPCPRCRTARSRRGCTAPSPSASVGVITPASSAPIAVIGLNVEPVG